MKAVAQGGAQIGTRHSVERLWPLLAGASLTALEDVEAVVLETDGSFSVIRQRGRSCSALVDVRGYPDASLETHRGL